ncbi:hypothetical protein Tco_0173068 [Tanacetum coccineum]
MITFCITELYDVISANASVIEEFVNDAFDSALDLDGMEDEIREEVDRVLTAIAGDTASHNFSGRLNCGSDSEAEDGLDNSMVVDEGEQDFTNPTDHRKFTSRMTRLHSN